MIPTLMLRAWACTGTNSKTAQTPIRSAALTSKMLDFDLIDILLFGIA
jgi:hypothetical protein